MTESIKTDSTSPEEALPSSVQILLKVLEHSDIVFHRTYDIYIELMQSRNVSSEILNSALELKISVEKFDKALHAEVERMTGIFPKIISLRRTGE